MDFQEGCQGNRRLWDRRLSFHHASSQGFSPCIPYLALRSLFLNLQMQAAKAGLEKQHSKHKPSYKPVHQNGS